MRILVVSRSVVGSRMSAPGIRAFHMAQILAEQVEGATVTLAIPEGSDLTAAEAATFGYSVYRYDRRSWARLIRNHDLLISLGFPPMAIPFSQRRLLIVDLFSNFAMEWMEAGKSQRNRRRRFAWYEAQRRYLNLQLTLADFVICNNERQRETWLGFLSSLGLISAAVYDRDRSLRRLVAVCPHGIRSDPLPDRRHSLDELAPGIGSGDRVLIWNGGIIDWYDPLTAIRAMAVLSRQRPEVKLLFVGSRYPDPGFADNSPTFQAAQALSRELGLYNRTVFFKYGWVPYEAMKSYLLGSCAGLSTYYDNAETHSSYRTRFVDLFWAELPLICTRGDILAEMVERRPLGLTVPEKNVDAVVAAVKRLLDDEQFYDRCRANLHQLKGEMGWEQTLQPLVAFCRDPRPIARSKPERLIPALGRAAGYLVWRVLARVMP
ncbi:MAG: glycosyltransferase family 4 protein [Dehalococcoidia bacterium]